MSDSSSSPTSSKGFGRIGWRLFALLLAGSMAMLVGVLYSECAAGREVVDAYVQSIKGGVDVPAGVGGNEASALTALLRTSDAIDVDNFQSQANTSCYWVSVHQAEKVTDAVFVLGNREAGVVVVAASIARDCECPDPDFDAPCHLR